MKNNRLPNAQTRQERLIRIQKTRDFERCTVELMRSRSRKASICSWERTSYRGLPGSPHNVTRNPRLRSHAVAAQQLRLCRCVAPVRAKPAACGLLRTSSGQQN